MKVYLAVNEFNKCRLLQIFNENISENEISEKMLINGEKLIEVKKEDLPKEVIDAWVWNEETKTVEVNDMLIPPDILQASNSLTELTTSEIVEMGADYLMMYHAVEKNLTGLINQMLMRIETAAYMAAPKVRIILEESGYKTLTK